VFPSLCAGRFHGEVGVAEARSFMISTRVHGILDYLVGVFFLFVPSIFGFAHGGPESTIFIILGIATLLYSLCTRYEWGLFKLLPMGTHLVLDLANGFLLAASPWIFRFADHVYLPHLAFGIFEIIVVLLSRRSPTYEVGKWQH
jgi:hypothetical protein